MSLGVFSNALRGNLDRDQFGVAAMENLLSLTCIVLICSTLGFLIAAYQNREWPWKF
jgi:hypothetical protein